MTNFYEWEWLVPRTQECVYKIIAELRSNELCEWQGSASQYFRSDLENVASQAQAMFEN